MVFNIYALAAAAAVVVIIVVAVVVVVVAAVITFYSCFKKYTSSLYLCVFHKICKG